MNNETYLDFCFIRPMIGKFAKDVDGIFQYLFQDARLNWYLDEKTEGDVEIVVAEVKGMSKWVSEEEVCTYLEDNAPEEFWKYLQGYKMFVYPAAYRRQTEVAITEETEGCSCGSH